ncbi:MAG: ankyrin repeat domain-containing protein [Alphaproteobacteria bacterium]|nr:ankyrin repeat domain-containing protein [Alphaproteobacteria bacterium]
MKKGKTVMDDLNKKLYEAVEKDDVKKEEELIKQGANAKASFNGDTLLHRAAEKGNVETIKFLAHHIDVDTKGRGGKTALHVAAESNQKDAAVTLIQLNANTEIRDDGNKIPIQRASIFKRTFWDMFWQMEAANCRDS